jgi:hypothetical protein
VPLVGDGPLAGAEAGFATLDAAKQAVLAANAQAYAGARGSARAKAVAIVSDGGRFVPVNGRTPLGGTVDSYSEDDAILAAEAPEYEVTENTHATGYLTQSPDVAAVIDSQGQDLPSSGRFTKLAELKSRLEYRRNGLVYPG